MISKTLKIPREKLSKMRRWRIKRTKRTSGLKRGTVLTLRRVTMKKKMKSLTALADSLPILTRTLMIRRRATGLTIKEETKLVVWRWISRTSNLRW